MADESGRRARTKRGWNPGKGADDVVSYHAALRPDWTRSQHLQYLVRGMMRAAGAEQAAIERVAGAAGVYYVLLERSVMEAMLDEAASIFAQCAGPGGLATLDVRDLRRLLVGAGERAMAHGVRATDEEEGR